MKIIINGEAVEIPGGRAGGSGIPSGGIIAYSGEAETIPEGWAVCDGENGTPDLRGRFILGVSETHPMGETGGEEEVTLTVDQMPSHDHTGSRMSTTGNKVAVSTSSSAVPHYYRSDDRTEVSGGSQPHPNMPPYYALIYIMKL